MNAVRWQVPMDHPAFAGHFPARPIVPGVVLLDRALQAISAAFGRQIVAVGNVKFLHAVGPGAQLDIAWAVATGNNVRFDIASAATVVATGTLTLAE